MVIPASSIDDMRKVMTLNEVKKIADGSFDSDEMLSAYDSLPYLNYPFEKFFDWVVSLFTTK